MGIAIGTHLQLARAARISFSCLLVAAALFLVACALVFGAEPLRYRLTVEVDTPEGLRTGSSVIEARVYGEPRLLPDMTGYSIDVAGEAVVVDLPGELSLFATLAGETPNGYPGHMALASFLEPADRNSLSMVEAARRLRGSRASGTVPRQAYPIFVRFRDIRNPRSAEGVDPDNLAATFGSGVRVRRIVIEMVNTEPTFVLQERFGWLIEPFRVIVRPSEDVGTVLSPTILQQR